MDLSGLFTHFEYFGFLGSTVILLAMIIPIPFYSGRSGERYSPFNHFISELGEVGVSKAARIFNVGLFVAGWCFLPYIIGLGLSIGSLWAKLGILAGIWTAVSCILIGVFPMNKMEQHVRAAMAFFRGGLVTVILFTLGIWFQRAGSEIIPRSVNLVGMASILAYSAFIAFGTRPPPGTELTDFLQEDFLKERPKIWHVPILEWLVLLSTIAWYLSTAWILALE